MTADASNTSKWAESLYERLAEDDEGRVCKDISEEACREVPGNFLRTLIANTLTQIGDRAASAKTTLPWLLASAGAPAWSASLLVPIRESGSMLPQLWLGGWVRRKPIRKLIWSIGSVGQGASLIAMGFAGITLSGTPAAAAMLLSLVIFSIARALSSIAYKDVLGKTIPKTRRGRLSGWISAVAGLGAMAAGAGIGIFAKQDDPRLYALLLAGAALLWFAAAAIYALMREFPGAVEGGEEGFRSTWSRLALLRDDAPLRCFVIARALAMGSGLAAPFYILLARRDLGEGAAMLGAFIAAEGLAGLISAPIWGRFADRSSRMVFAVACASASMLSLLVALRSWADVGETGARWFFPLVFFGLGIAHAGVRLGRKTYLVDIATGNRRTDYVAVSNTVIGALLLLTGLVGALAATISIELTLVLLAVAGFVGAALSMRLPEA